MSAETKVVKGGFRATLALIISIVALILAIVAFNQTGGQADLNAQVKDLSTKMEKMKKETSEKMSKVRQETAKALEKVGIDIKKEEKKE
jgi:membrane protein insertase Oxa1/YidC/SpoIIIJ